MCTWGAMDALYLETNSIIQQVHQGLAQLENMSDQATAATLETAIVEQLKTVVANCDQLDLMCENQPMNRRKYAKQLVEQLRYDCDHVKVALSGIQNRLLMAWKQKSEREELLSRRFTPNESTCIYLDDAAAVHNYKLRSVHKNVDNMIDTGRSVLVTLLIYSLFTAEVSSGYRERYVFYNPARGSDPFITSEPYMTFFKKECKELFDVFPQLTPQRYQFQHSTRARCNEREIDVTSEGLQWRKRSYVQGDPHIIPESEQYALVAIKRWAPDAEKKLTYECDINEPVYGQERYAAIDCGAFADDCIYRRAIYKGRDYKPGMKFVLLDAARIVKRIKRVIKGTINYQVTLILSLGNGTHMNLNYTVKAFSYVEINQTDPFYFAHGDLLKLYRESQFPLCIYRAWDTVHSQYYPCRDRYPKKYFWDKTINRLNNHAGLIAVVLERAMLPKHEKQDHPQVIHPIQSYWFNSYCYSLLCPYSKHHFFKTYTGLYCEQNLDECAYGVHNCPPGWECRDT
ncbi:hypothetical protein M514_20111, partial [Trichuris suis]